jgi:H+-transporting ATPase
MKPLPEPSTQEMLAGLVERVTYHNAENGFCVLRAKARGHRDLVTLVGHAATIANALKLFHPGPPGRIPDRVGPEDFSVFAAVLPEDKFRLVKAFQNGGHTVGRCGDGANDAPALRQAQIGIAVSTATDVAKSAAGIVLTEPGLAGIVASVREGRITCFSDSD